MKSYPYHQKITNQTNCKILIIDFGCRLTKQIACLVSSQHILCKIYPYTISEKIIRKFDPRGIILSGGPASVTQKNHPTVSPFIFSMKKPVLGICYGHQLMCKQLGGYVQKAPTRIHGKTLLTIVQNSSILTGIQQNKDQLEVWMNYEDHVTKIPKGFNVIGFTSDCPNAFIADEKRRFYGVQFHPESPQTADGNMLIHMFITHIVNNYTVPQSISAVNK